MIGQVPPGQPASELQSDPARDPPLHDLRQSAFVLQMFPEDGPPLHDLKQSALVLQMFPELGPPLHVFRQSALVVQNVPATGPPWQVLAKRGDADATKRHETRAHKRNKRFIGGPPFHINRIS